MPLQNYANKWAFYELCVFEYIHFLCNMRFHGFMIYWIFICLDAK